MRLALGTLGEASLHRCLFCLVVVVLVLTSSAKAQADLPSQYTAFGVVTGLSFSSGNPGLRSGRFFLEGQMDVRIKGPVSVLSTAGCAFTSSESDRTFTVNAFSVALALKLTIPTATDRFRPFVAFGPALFDFDPSGKVDSADAQSHIGVVLYMGAQCRLSGRWTAQFVSRFGFTGSSAERFPLQVPPGPKGRYLQGYLGVGMGVRF